MRMLLLSQHRIYSCCPVNAVGEFKKFLLFKFIVLIPSLGNFPLHFFILVWVRFIHSFALNDNSSVLLDAFRNNLSLLLDPLPSSTI